jgi:hypothetical protein
MTELDIYLPVALVVLLAYLLWSFNRRLNAQIAKAEARFKDWQCRGFEASIVSPRIDLLRRDYVNAVRTGRPPPFARMEKVAKVRCAVRELSFFRQLSAVAESAGTVEPKLTVFPLRGRGS